MCTRAQEKRTRPLSTTSIQAILTTLLDHLQTATPRDAASAAYDAVTTTSSTQEGHRVVLATLHRHSWQRAARVAVEYAQLMRANCAPLDTSHAELVLRAHVALKELPVAERLLSKMLSLRGGQPPADDACITAVLKPLIERGALDRAEALLEQLVGRLPSARTAALALHVSFFVKALVGCGQLERAEHWLVRSVDELREPASTVAHNALLAAYAAASDPLGACRVLGLLERAAALQPPPGGGSSVAGSAAPPTLHSVTAADALSLYEVPHATSTGPDRVSYNTLIAAFARCGEPLWAESAFSSLVQHGLKPDQFSYSTVISAHSRAGNVSRAQFWLARMIESGIRPDAVTFNTLCSAHARMGDARSALACFQAMIDEGITASSMTHSIMVHALVQAGDLAAAEMTLRTLIEQGAQLSASSFNPLVTAYAKKRRTDLAEAVLTLMINEAGVEPSMVTFNAIAAAHASQGDFDSVEKILTEGASRHGEAALDRFSYGALLQSASKKFGFDSPESRQQVMRLMFSGVQMNAYLQRLCTCTVDQSFLDEMHALLEERRRAAATAAPRRGRGSQAARSRRHRSSGATASSGGIGGGPQQAQRHFSQWVAVAAVAPPPPRWHPGSPQHIPAAFAPPTMVFSPLSTYSSTPTYVLPASSYPPIATCAPLAAHAPSKSVAPPPATMPSPIIDAHDAATSLPPSASAAYSLEPPPSVSAAYSLEPAAVSEPNDGLLGSARGALEGSLVADAHDSTTRVDSVAAEEADAPELPCTTALESVRGALEGSLVADAHDRTTRVDSVAAEEADAPELPCATARVESALVHATPRGGSSSSSREDSSNRRSPANSNESSRESSFNQKRTPRHLLVRTISNSSGSDGVGPSPADESLAQNFSKLC